MFLKRLLPLILCPLIGGCILQSHEPNFGEADGVALPVALVTKYQLEVFEDGGWKLFEGKKSTFNFTPSGNHYVVLNESEQKSYEFDVLFAALGKDRWVAQKSAAYDSSEYWLVKAKDGALLVLPLLCHDLQKRDDVKNFVIFIRDDCFLDGKTGLDVFEMFATDARTTKLRLEPIK